MSKLCYVPKTFTADHLAIIEQADAILEARIAQGFTLTLRQLFYAFVAHHAMENTQQKYKRLGDIIREARRAGLIDWAHMQDLTRHLREANHWNDPADIIRDDAAQFALDKWQNQKVRLEVWVEKDAALGVVEQVCARHDVPYFSCRGYDGDLDMWGAGQRFKGYLDQGYDPVLLHLGDHDPSGIDMTRDIADRLALFAGAPILVRRIALSIEQVQEYVLPPNFAKVEDTRYADYRTRFGEESWELDALEPSVLVDLLEAAILDYKDPVKWQRAVTQETTYKKTLKWVAAHWELVERLKRDETRTRKKPKNPAEDE